MAKTYKQVMEEARQLVPEVSPDDVKARLDRGERPVLLDVREREEFRQGFVPGAVSLPRGFLEMRVEETVPAKDTPIVAYCGGGTRWLLAGRIWKELGYTNVVSMRGGFRAWKNQGLPVREHRPFTPEQQIRYSRHFLLPEVGEKGQAKLLDAKVLCIGAGGLGSPALFYLAAAGVGTLGIVDMDVVDLSNLQRQILHTNDRIGMPKTESARLTLQALNPDVKVLEFRERLSSENAFRIFEQFDIVVNGSDNFPTRYLANDACVMLKKPLVDGAIWQFEGQATDGDEAHRLGDVLRGGGRRGQGGRAGRRPPSGAGAAATVGCVKNQLGPHPVRRRAAVGPAESSGERPCTAATSGSAASSPSSPPSSGGAFSWHRVCCRSEERRVGKECRSRWSPYH